MTKVANVRKHKYDVYIGRAGHGQDGRWGNPCVVGRKCTECGEVHSEGGSTLPCYEKYLIRRLHEPEFRAAFKQLDGKTLGCFCVGAIWQVGDTGALRCHGQIMALVLEELKALKQ